MPFKRLYHSLYQRLVANTVLEDPDRPDGCWLWTGAMRRGYPCLAVRPRGSGRNGLRTVAAHRAMLEEVHDVWFPFDEAGHLCCNPRCINPDHLEIQAPAHNLSDRRGYAPLTGAARWIPVLYPRAEATNEPAWDSPGVRSAPGAPCPF